MAETYPEPTEMEQRGFLGSAEAAAGVPPAVLSAPLELTLSRTVFSYPPRKRSPLISKTRCGPAIICLSLDAMLKAVNAREFDMVASWSVDRLGRSLTDLLSILQGRTTADQQARHGTAKAFEVFGPSVAPVVLFVWPLEMVSRG